jgi:hypothetical protein
MPFLVKLAPPGFWRFVIRLGPNTSIRRAQELVDIMDRTSIKIFKTKNVDVQPDDEAFGKDLMSILCMF